MTTKKGKQRGKPAVDRGAGKPAVPAAGETDRSVELAGHANQTQPGAAADADATATDGMASSTAGHSKPDPAPAAESPAGHAETENAVTIIRSLDTMTDDSHQPVFFGNQGNVTHEQESSLETGLSADAAASGQRDPDGADEGAGGGGNPRGSAHLEVAAADDAGAGAAHQGDGEGDALGDETAVWPEPSQFVAGAALAAGMAGSAWATMPTLDMSFCGADHRPAETAAAFVRANPDAPAEAIPIELARKGFRGLPEVTGRVMMAWRIFIAALKEIDAQEARERAAEADAQPKPPAPTYGGKQAFEAQPEPFAPSGFSARR